MPSPSLTFDHPRRSQEGQCRCTLLTDHTFSRNCRVHLVVGYYTNRSFAVFPVVNCRKSVFGYADVVHELLYVTPFVRRNLACATYISAFALNIFCSPSLRKWQFHSFVAGLRARCASALFLITELIITTAQGPLPLRSQC